MIFVVGQRGKIMDDLISRQALLAEYDRLHVGEPGRARKMIEDAPSAQPDLNEWCTDCKEYDKEKHHCPRFNRVIREALKDAQPERKPGKWIERKHGYWSFVNDKGERDGWIPSYECSECGSGGWRYPEVMNFCPSCGADMRGEQNEKCG